MRVRWIAIVIPFGDRVESSPRWHSRNRGLHGPRAPNGITNWISLLLVALLFPRMLRAEGEWEITPASEIALANGLEWLAKNQGREGNWTSNDLGLVGLGTLAFLADGHAPGRGLYGDVVQRSLDYVLNNAQPNGLLNISNPQRDMYNHGLATFVLGQAHGTTTSADSRLREVLGRALQLIADTQCNDGGWDYRAKRGLRGHDLSLAVMQAKALRSAADSGLYVSPTVVNEAIISVREHYWPRGGNRDAPEAVLMRLPGQFAYSKAGGGETIAMAAAGVVCLQEFGRYDDWRISKNMDVILAAIQELPEPRRNGTLPFDAYTMYYVGQALYQTGGPAWDEHYPRLRDYLVASQVVAADNPAVHGSWRDNGANGGGKIAGRPGEMFGTAVACFILAMPNRYLPILQTGHNPTLPSTVTADDP